MGVDMILGKDKRSLAGMCLVLDLGDQCLVRGTNENAALEVRMTHDYAFQDRAGPEGV